MNKLIVPTLLLVLAFSEARSESLGVGLSIGEDSKSLLMPINNATLRIEPFISWYKLSGSGYKVNKQDAGIGVFRKHVFRRKLNVLYGLKISYRQSELKASSIYPSIPSEDVPLVESGSNEPYQGSLYGYVISPTLSVEYPINKNLLISIENSQNFESLDGYSGATEKAAIKAKSSDNKTNLVVRYFFN